jgi:hypothetical protein
MKQRIEAWGRRAPAGVARQGVWTEPVAGAFIRMLTLVFADLEHRYFLKGSTCECSKLFKTSMECAEIDIVLSIHIFKWISWSISEREISKISPGSNTERNGS